MSSTTADIGDGPAQVIFRARLTDADGVDWANVTFEQFRNLGRILPAVQLALVEGTATDGIWEGTVTFTQDLPLDMYVATLATADVNDVMVPVEPGATVDVVNSHIDSHKPRVALPLPAADVTTADVTDAPQAVTVTAHLTDDRGVTDAVASFQRHGSADAPLAAALARTAGEATDGTWVATVVFPTTTYPGQYDLAVSATDAAGNSVTEWPLSVTSSGPAAPPATASGRRP